MSTIVLSLIPIFVLIVAGHVFRRTGWLPEAFWPAAEKLTYFVFFPALLLQNTAKAQLGGIAIGPGTAALTMPLILAALV